MSLLLPEHNSNFELFEVTSSYTKVFQFLWFWFDATPFFLGRSATELDAIGGSRHGDG